MNPNKNLTGMLWYVDVHVIDSPSATSLRHMNDEGWIYLQITDTLLAEISQVAEPKRQMLRDQAAHYPAALGPMVLGHSVPEYSLAGSAEDEDRIRKVYSILWPKGDYDADSTSASRTGQTRFRDALHVATTIRCASGDAFITDDERVLRRADALREVFPNFRLLSVSEATAEAFRRIATVRRRSQLTGRPDRSELPSWPTDDEINTSTTSPLPEAE